MGSITLDHMALFIVAVLNAYTAWTVARTHSTTLATANNIQLIEKATNSMKDALVISTEKASFAEGKEAGRVQQKQLTDAKAAVFAEGVKSTLPPKPVSPKVS